MVQQVVWGAPSTVTNTPESVEASEVDPKDTNTRRGGLTKADLIETVYDRHGALTKAEAAEVVNTIFRAMRSSLADGRSVRITNFGTFQVVRRPARRGVSPASGEDIEIPARRGLSFRPARHLRHVVAPLPQPPSKEKLPVGRPGRAAKSATRKLSRPEKGEL